MTQNQQQCVILFYLKNKKQPLTIFHYTTVKTMSTAVTASHPHLQILDHDKETRKKVMFLIRQYQYQHQILEQQRRASQRMKSSSPQVVRLRILAFFLIKEIFFGLV